MCTSRRVGSFFFYSFFAFSSRALTSIHSLHHPYVRCVRAINAMVHNDRKKLLSRYPRLIRIRDEYAVGDLGCIRITCKQKMFNNFFSPWPSCAHGTSERVRFVRVSMVICVQYNDEIVKRGRKYAVRPSTR
jgi:hypothetical protein